MFSVSRPQCRARLSTRWRSAVIQADGVPPSSPLEPAIFRVVAKIAHVLLYGLLIGMPVTGMAAYYLGYDGAGDVHADILKVALWALIAGHVLGALTHQFYWKTNVLRRMTAG